MASDAKVWNTLHPDYRKVILIACYPARSRAIAVLESRKDWNDLLPSTQEDLSEMNWSMVLRRDVRPD